MLGFMTLFLMSHYSRDSNHPSIDAATCRKFWLSSNLNYLLQNSDQIVALIFFSSQFHLLSIFIRLFKLFDPLLNSYNQLIATEYARDLSLQSSREECSNNP